MSKKLLIGAAGGLALTGLLYSHFNQDAPPPAEPAETVVSVSPKKSQDAIRFAAYPLASEAYTLHKNGILADADLESLQNAIERIATNPPPALQAVIDDNRDNIDFYDDYGIFAVRDELKKSLPESLEDFMDDHHQKDGCFLVQQDYETILNPAGIDNVTCRDNKVTHITLYEDRGGITNIYDYTDETAFFLRDEAAHDEKSLAALPFEQLPDSHSERVGQLKAALEQAVAQNYSALSTQYAAQAPQIRADIAATGTAPVAAPAPR